MNQLAALATLTIVLALGAGDEPPTEFRIFRAGENDTTKGSVLFDEVAAKSVMADYADWGVDLMVDYEHASLGAVRAPDPKEAGKAAAWLNLEVRDGELWAVNVRWTAPAAAALKIKEYRYFSPAFFPPKPGRVERMVNLALTNIPAMKNLEPLMAASARAADQPPARDHRAAALSSGASLQDTQRAVQAAVSDLYPPAAAAGTPTPCPWVCDIYEASAVYEYDGKLFEVPYSFDGASAKLGAPVPVKRAYQPLTAPAAPPAPATETTTEASRLSQGAAMDPKLVQEALDALVSGDADKAMELLKGIIASAASGGAPPPPDDAPAPADEMAAASRELMRLTAKQTLAEALVEFERRNKRIGELEEQETRLSRDKATLEAGRRDAAVAEMVTLGSERPATAWADPLIATDRAKRKPAEPWATMPIEALEQRVAALRAAPPARNQPLPPAGAGTGAHGLSEAELALCKRKGVDPEKYAAQRLAIRERSHHAA